MTGHILRLCKIYNESDIEQFQTYYDAMFEHFADDYRSVHGYLSMLICVAGILGNIAIVIVLSDRTMRSSVNTLLIGIACFDMSLMVVYLCYQIVILYPIVYVSYGGQLFTVVFANWSMVAHSVSLWLTVVMAFIRFMILMRRTVYQGKWNSIKLACISILCTTMLVSFASILNMARNKIVKYERPQNSSLQLDGQSEYVYRIQPPGWWDCSMERLNFWITGVTLKIIPCILLTLVMTLLIKEVVSAGQRRARLMGMNRTRMDNEEEPKSRGLLKIKSFTDNNRTEKTDRITTVLLSIVVIFWITEMPQGVLYILTAIKPATFFVYQHLGDVIDLLSLLNSCVNFVLYCAMSTVFRQRFMFTFCRRRVNNESHKSPETPRLPNALYMATSHLSATKEECSKPMLHELHDINTDTIV